MSGPKVIVEDAAFRIVRTASGNYVTETPDGCDALGVERWRELTMDNKHWRAFRDFIIRAHVAQENKVEQKQSKRERNPEPGDPLV